MCIIREIDVYIYIKMFIAYNTFMNGCLHAFEVFMSAILKKLRVLISTTAFVQSTLDCGVLSRMRCVIMYKGNEVLLTHRNKHTITAGYPPLHTCSYTHVATNSGRMKHTLITFEGYGSIKFSHQDDMLHTNLQRVLIAARNAALELANE